MLLQGKTIIVTGGNSGIGAAIVLAAAAEGSNVVIDFIEDSDSADRADPARNDIKNRKPVEYFYSTGLFAWIS
jgi:NAD(P)-dependent dehydrogenase (short-subunit alcohol dehydrogenase family)